MTKSLDQAANKWASKMKADFAENLNKAKSAAGKWHSAFCDFAGQGSKACKNASTAMYEQGLSDAMSNAGKISEKFTSEQYKAGIEGRVKPH